MDGMGKERNSIMYEYVNQAEVERYRKFCSETLLSLCASLKEDGITAQPVLIGSGARNLVTKNGNGTFDLDYNLEIIRLDPAYEKNLFNLKNRVMRSLNQLHGDTFFSDAKDSTSAITAIHHLKDTPRVQFSFDIGIVKKNRQGNYCRLIHQKAGSSLGTFTWCEIPTSSKVGEKASAIKKAGKWDDVRQRYLKLKNQYLSTGDRNHPSFVVYVEAVNEAYEVNDGGCYRIRRLEENLYREFLPKTYKTDDVITYQWQQNRDTSLKGHFNFYYNITKNSVSKGSMFIYLIILTALSVVGDLLAALICKLIGL